MICLLISLRSFILSKISNISIPSRKRSHIPPWGTPENHRLKSAGWQGICDRSSPGRKTCHKLRQVSGSLILLIVCHHLGLRPVFGLHWRYQQANVFPNAGIRFRLPQSGGAKGKILHLDGCFVFFSAVSKMFQGEYSWNIESFALDISAIKILFQVKYIESLQNSNDLHLKNHPNSAQ